MVEPSHRSIIPGIPGVPWWAAVLIAVGSTTVGYLIDAGHKELTHTFAGFYIAGCVAAVLAVRQAGVFTAVIQPPLILFLTVPGAYWLFHGAKVDKFKDLLINCGYPLIERFPLMLGTAGGVLLIGLIRWFFGKSGRAAAAGEAATTDGAAERAPAGLMAKLSSLLGGGSDADTDAGVQPAHAKGRSAATNRVARSGARAGQRPAPTRSRHARPAADDDAEPGAERPRRRSSAIPPEYADYDPTEAARRARRPRPPSDSDRGTPPPRERRREPPPRRSTHERSYERPGPRTSRFDPYESYDRPEPSERGERRSRHERRDPGYEPYPPYDPPSEPRSRRTTPPGSGNPSHQPISQARYRGQPPRTEPRDERRDEPRPERRNRSQRAPRRPQPESWE